MFRETPEVLLTKVQNLLRVNLHIRRDIPITKVSRMYTGITSGEDPLAAKNRIQGSVSQTKDDFVLDLKDFLILVSDPDYFLDLAHELDV